MLNLRWEHNSTLPFYSDQIISRKWEIYRQNYFFMPRKFWWTV